MADQSLSNVVDLLRELREERAARLKAEGERDETQRAKYGTPCRCDSWITACGLAEERADAAEARLRAVIEAANRLVTGGWNQSDWNAAVANYRRVRDAQASPEPEASPRVHEFAGPIHHDFQHNHSPTVSIRERCLVCGFTSQAHLCWSCGLPWSQHRERR